MWSLDELVEPVIAALSRREAELREEQAVRGIDALDELGLHPLVAAALAETGRGVLREQAYPHEWTRKAAVRVDTSTGEVLPESRQRQRCDLVLTEHAGQRLNDSLHRAKARRQAREAVKGTLFEALGGAEALCDAQVDRAGLVEPEEAFWLEVKVVAQFCFNAGVLGPNRAYASELVRGPIADVTKLAADRRVQHAGVLVVLFTADEATAKNDLGVLLHKCLDKGLPITSPATRSTGVVDRIGNRVCTASLVGVRAVHEPEPASVFDA